MSLQTYRLINAWDIQGQFAQNIVHYYFEDSGYNSTFAAADALITQWEAHSKAAWLALIPSAVRLLSVKARRVSAAGGFDAVHVQAGGTVGTRTGALQVAGVGPCIISYQIGNGKKRGRTFLPGVTETDCIEGVLQSGWLSAFNSNVTAFHQDLTLVGGGAPTAKFVIYTPTGHSSVLISGMLPSVTVGTQRRRQLPA